MATIEEYFWDSGNGQYSSSASPTFLYLPGQYTVSLRAKIGGVWLDKTKYSYIVVAETEENLMDADYLNYPKSYHLGFAERHGFNWSENEGDNWIWPESSAAIFETEYNGEVVKIVYDLNDNKPYIINTRDSAGISASYKDKDVYDIPATILLPEHHGERKKFIVEHVETDVVFSPILGGAELESTFTVDMGLITNSREEPVETIKDIDIEEEVVFKYSVTSTDYSKNRQLKIETNESKFQLLNYETIYKVIDKFLSADTDIGVNEEVFLSTPTVWHTRGNYSLDLISGSLISTIGTLTTGPDLRSGSSYLLSSDMILGNALLSSASIMLWYKGATPTISGGAVALIDYATSGSWKLAYANDDLPANLSISSGSEVFDIRLYSGTITTTAIDLYKQNIENFLRSF